MIYSRKWQQQRDGSSTGEKLLSILGLFGVSGFLGGLSALIYGLIKPSRSGLIGGAIVAACSACLCLLLILVYLFCMKSKRRNRRLKNSQRSTNQSIECKQTRSQNQHQQTSFHDESHSSQQPIPSISAMTHQSIRQSPTKPTSGSYLDQSHTSLKSQKQPIIQSTTKQIRYR